MRCRVIVRGDYAEHLVTHRVQDVIVCEISRADDLDARGRKPALCKLLGENTRLGAGKIQERRIRVEIANTLQKRGKIGIREGNSDRFDDLPAELGEALLECRFRL